MLGPVWCGVAVLLLDWTLCAGFWAVLLHLGCPGCGGLAGLWAFGALKWVLLEVSVSALGAGRAELHRFVALLCLLRPVLELGRTLLAGPPGPHGEPGADLSMLLLGGGSSVFACLVWEKLSSGGEKKQDRPDTKRILMRVLTYFKPDTLHLLTAFTFLIIGVICDTYIPLYQGKVIDQLSGQTLHASFGSTLGLLVLFSVGSAVFSGMRGGVFMCALSRLNRRLKLLLFQRLLQQEVHFFEENNPGRLSSRLHSDVDRMGLTVALNANAAVRSSVKTVLMLRVMLGLSWELSLLTCVEMPLLAFLQSKYISLSKELKEQTQECHAQLKDQASQTIGGIQTVRSFRAEEDELRRYRLALDQLCAIKRRSGIYSAVFLIIRRIVTVGIKILMLMQARSLISSGRLTTGSLLSFLLYQKPMSNNLREILYCYRETVSTVGVISKVLGYLDRRPRTQPEGDLAPEHLEGRVLFQNVSFSYPSAPNKPALKDVSVELQPGRITALVGPSGGGKSSCVGLLKRLYEPGNGRILLDGEPLHHYRHKYLQQKIALVSQNPTLFSGSLRSNVEYGLPDCPPERAVDVAKRVNAHAFISEMEHQYETDIGEGGGRLSAGQRQSVAIIRALVRDPQVIVLDEATSRLDVDSQHAVLREVLARGRTVLLVTHQLSTAERAHRILVMEDGSVVETGTHKELISRKGRYYRLSRDRSQAAEGGP
ncbi:antigen peptide transporter 2 isoform 1-T3 [Menidia menidia]